MLLTSAFVAFALLLITVVVSATGVHLDRKRLFNLADASALAAADSMTHETYYEGGLPVPQEQAVLVLTDAEVRAEVVAYLAANPQVTAGLDGLGIVSATSPDGRSAHVALSARSRPVLLSWVLAPWGGGIDLHAEASARAW